MVATILISWRLVFILSSVFCIWSAKAARTPRKSFLHAGVTGACRSVVRLYDNEENVVDGNEDLSMICSGPGGIDKLILPVSTSAADQLIGLQVLNPWAGTIITIHGFNDNPDSDIPYTISNNFVSKGLYNVMQLDTQKVTVGSYLRAVHKSWQVGDIFAKFLAHLYSAGAIKPSKVHIVGLSLGAQIAGRIGRSFKELTGKKIGRITGLDPAGPCFEYSDTGLSKRDAKFVNIIHVNQGVEGIIEGVGHADYLVNGGGPNQPGCLTPPCSHQRAGLVYIVSMDETKDPFYARKCDSWFNFLAGKCDDNELSTMGYNSSTSKKGLFYLKTEKEWPYTMGLSGSKSGNHKLLYRILGG